MLPATTNVISTYCAVSWFAVNVTAHWQGAPIPAVPCHFCTNQGPNRSLPEPCPCPVLHGDIVEPLILQAVADLLRNPQLIMDYYFSRQDQNDIHPPELKRVRQELDQIGKQDQRLLDAYQAEIIDLNELATRRQTLQQQRLILEARLAELEQLAHK
jgi:hypothetical protein